MAHDEPAAAEFGGTAPPHRPPVYERRPTTQRAPAEFGGTTPPHRPPVHERRPTVSRVLTSARVSAERSRRFTKISGAGVHDRVRHVGARVSRNYGNGGARRGPRGGVRH